MTDLLTIRERNWLGDQGQAQIEVKWNRLEGDLAKTRQALDFIVSDATITPEGCPEPWRSTLIEWVQAANHALNGETT